MRLYWLVAIAAGVLMAGLGVGWAAPQFEPPLLPDGLDLEEMSLYQAEAGAHIEADYGDCTLGFEHGAFSFVNGSSNISLDCRFPLGGGASGSGSDEYPSLLSRDFDDGSDYIRWERDGIEFCSLETTSHVRPPESGPNTLLITVNCWWFDEIKETVFLNSTLPDMPLSSLVNEADHVILGVVTQINAHSTAGANRTVFTDVVIAVNENLKGTYGNPLLTVRFEGGEAEDLIVINEDAPEFEVGESVFVLVAEPDNGDNYTIVGLSQGKYQIGKDGLAENKDHYKISTLDELRLVVDAALTGDG